MRWCPPGEGLLTVAYMLSSTVSDKGGRGFGLIAGRGLGEGLGERVATGRGGSRFCFGLQTSIVAYIGPSLSSMVS